MTAISVAAQGFRGRSISLWIGFGIAVFLLRVVNLLMRNYDVEDSFASEDIKSVDFIE